MSVDVVIRSRRSLSGSRDMRHSQRWKGNDDAVIDTRRLAIP